MTDATQQRPLISQFYRLALASINQGEHGAFFNEELLPFLNDCDLVELYALAGIVAVCSDGEEPANCCAEIVYAYASEVMDQGENRPEAVAWCKQLLREREQADQERAANPAEWWRAIGAPAKGDEDT